MVGRSFEKGFSSIGCVNTTSTFCGRVASLIALKSTLKHLSLLSEMLEFVALNVWLIDPPRRHHPSILFRFRHIICIRCWWRYSYTIASNRRLNTTWNTKPLSTWDECQTSYKKNFEPQPSRKVLRPHVMVARWQCNSSTVKIEAKRQKPLLKLDRGYNNNITTTTQQWWQAIVQIVIPDLTRYWQ